MRLKYNAFKEILKEPGFWPVLTAGIPTSNIFCKPANKVCQITLEQWIHLANMNLKSLILLNTHPSVSWFNPEFFLQLDMVSLPLNLMLISTVEASPREQWVCGGRKSICWPKRNRNLGKTSNSLVAFPDNDSHMLAKSDVENCDISHNVPGNVSQPRKTDFYIWKILLLSEFNTNHCCCLDQIQRAALLFVTFQPLRSLGYGIVSS